MYGKFFSSTFTGSMFGAGADVFAVWGYVIANAVESTVDLNPDLLGAVLGMTPERVKIAITFLCCPDEWSRNHDQDGRRLIQQGPFQFHVVSHKHYKGIRNEDDRREYNRRKQAESRARRQTESTPMSLTVNDGSAMSTMSAYTEAEADTEAKEQIPPLPPKGETIKSSEFFDAWNQLCGKLPKAEKLTPGRIKKIQARVRNGLTLSQFCEAVRRCTVKPFLSGNNDRGWTATFDWLIANDENAEKAIVNPYGNAANGKHVQAGADNQKQIIGY